MKCPSCHSDTPDTSKFCISCGAALPPRCSSCGSANRVRAKFCLDCGQKLAGAPTEPATIPTVSPTSRAEGSAERRQLAAMFVDLVGSTTLSARLDPEDMREIIGAYHRCCAEQISKAGGFVAKYMGEGVLAYFGYPQAHEDDAERAVRAALGLTEAVPSLRSEHDAALHVRISIATGAERTNIATGRIIMLVRSTVALALAIALGLATPASAADRKYGPGVTDSEIKIGETMPYSGPLSNVGTIGRAEMAYFRMLNENGGINGRKVNLISLDDAYSPPKAFEQVRKLVEQEQVLAIFSIIGTPTAAAVQRYLNENKVPQLFMQSGAPRFADPRQYPWTMPIWPGYADEARVYAKYLLQTRPEAKIGVLFQNDDFGRAYLGGLTQGLGDRGAKMIVKEATYEPTDPTVDSQIISLQASGADVLFNTAIPRMAAQAIRKAYDIGWRPTLIVASVSASVPTVLKPAGLEKSMGAITALWGITPGDPRWQNNPDYQAYVGFMSRYYPEGDVNDGANFAGYSWAFTLAHVLDQCGDDLTRENVMRQAVSMKDFHAPGLLPGIALNTSPTDYRPIKQFVLHRFDGQTWAPFSEVMEVTSAQ